MKIPLFLLSYLPQFSPSFVFTPVGLSGWTNFRRCVNARINPAVQHKYFDEGFCIVPVGLIGGKLHEIEVMNLLRMYIHWTAVINGRYNNLVISF
ncbi:hypothetical protein BD289DRAFT_163105 [Coniella lustricola]|uniref:Uncharacterized protein n=1 Tax=Coniella lustricola TaxID=2025994 RepID=A0A2T3AEA9_9PEZI|nr:hypothetical protein BD289DRAFT_163105 [Coniella lustricola]